MLKYQITQQKSLPAFARKIRKSDADDQLNWCAEQIQVKSTLFTVAGEHKRVARPNDKIYKGGKLVKLLAFEQSFFTKYLSGLQKA